MFHTESEAKTFFADKVIEQASLEGIEFTEAERHMLRWSESDPDFIPDLDFADQVEADKDYESKIAGLIKRVYERDIANDKMMHSVYREAYKVLRRGDHYILILIDQALGGRLMLLRSGGYLAWFVNSLAGNDVKLIGCVALLMVGVGLYKIWKEEGTFSFRNPELLPTIIVPPAIFMLVLCVYAAFRFAGFRIAPDGTIPGGRPYVWLVAGIIFILCILVVLFLAWLGIL